MLEDTTPPTVTCPAGTTAAADANCQAVVPNVLGGVTVSDNIDTSPTLAQNPSVGTLVGSGVHTFTVTATDDAGNSATCTTTFTVTDATPPVVNCPPGTSASADANCQAPVPCVLPGVTASDNCDASVSLSQTPVAGTLVGPGVHTITVTAADDAGNSATCTTTFTVADTTPPAITCPADITVLSSTEPPVPVTFAATATDACDPSPAITYSIAPGSNFPLGETVVTCTATDASGNQSQCSFRVTVQRQPLDYEVILADLNRSRVHFDHNGNSEFAFFWGNLEMTDGNLALDFRPTPGHTAQGSLKVTIADVLAYGNDNLTFAVHDCDSWSNDREKWTYNAGPKEKMFLRWRDDQQYDATRDPNVPSSLATGNKNIGKLETRFIHDDETRFRYEFKQAAKPITITVDGLVLLTVAANGTVSSPFPCWKYGKVVEVLYPDRLVPGTEMAWYADGDLSNNGGLPENLIYEHDAAARGNSTDTYFNAGGRFFIKVPVTGLNLASVPRSAKVEFTVGKQGVTLVGHSEFAVPGYDKVWTNWKFNDGPDDCEGED